MVGVINFSFLIFLTKLINGLYISLEPKSVKISSLGKTSIPYESINVNSIFTGPIYDGKVLNCANVISMFLGSLLVMLTNSGSNYKGMKGGSFKESEFFDCFVLLNWFTMEVWLLGCCGIEFFVLLFGNELFVWPDPIGFGLENCELAENLCWVGFLTDTVCWVGFLFEPIWTIYGGW